MKVLHKKTLVKRRMVAQALGQRDIPIRKVVNVSSFRSRIRFSFQTPENLYLITYYHSGGELWDQLYLCGRFQEQCVKFRLAELVLIIQHLHEHDLNLAYLRPANLLLDNNGHLIFSDFGLFEILPGGKEELIEDSAEYLAPEIIAKECASTKASVFWSLGVLAFEMCCGWSPFWAEDAKQMLKNIRYGKIRFPRDRLSVEGGNFVKKLLNRNQGKRLGGVHGAAELKVHEFFSDIDWAAMGRKEVGPPPLTKPKSDDVDSPPDLDHCSSSQGLIFKLQP